MFVLQSRLILQHAAPMLIAQLASMGMMVIDTALLGHYGTEDLAPWRWVAEFILRWFLR